jgi:hypothetical protein
VEPNFSSAVGVMAHVKLQKKTTIVGISHPGNRWLSLYGGLKGIATKFGFDAVWVKSDHD